MICGRTYWKCNANEMNYLKINKIPYTKCTMYHVPILKIRMECPKTGTGK